MLQRIHNILAWITINTKTEASIWALKLQTKLTNRYPHLNPPTDAPSLSGMMFDPDMYLTCYNGKRITRGIHLDD